MNLFKLSLPLAVFFVALTFIGCDKAPDCDLPALDTRNSCDGPASTDGLSSKQLILNYLSDNNITAQETSTGLFYSIIDEGSSERPVLGNDVTVDYSGYFRNGCSFDANNGITFGLLNLITGWQEGIPLVGICGKIQLFVIPELGYGASPPVGIPADEPLIFDINLLDFE